MKDFKDINIFKSLLPNLNNFIFNHEKKIKA